MARPIILVEGLTEAGFVDQILAPHLYQVGHTDIRPVLMGDHRGGGIARWGPVRKDILRFLQQSAGNWVTMMIDYSGMPQSWPGRRQAARMRAASAKARTVEQALLHCISPALENFHPVRFVPNVIMHEFEGLRRYECRGVLKG